MQLDDAEIIDIFSRVPGPAARPNTGADSKSGKSAGRAALLDPKRAHLLSISIKSIKAPVVTLRESLLTMDRTNLTSRDVEVRWRCVSYKMGHCCSGGGGGGVDCLVWDTHC